jgi:AcrR family transcriptional regulator
MGNGRESWFKQRVTPGVEKIMTVVECPNTPKIDPRVRRTRKLLEDAFRALLAERSYQEISVADISERATVNRATFYAHFEDKQDLATKMLRGAFEAALLARLERPKPLSEESLSEIAAAVFEFMDGMKQNCPKMANSLDALVGPTLQEALQSFISTWLKLDPDAMRLFPGSSPETVITVLSWSIFGGAMRWKRRTRRPAASAAAREIVRLLLR